MTGSIFHIPRNTKGDQRLANFLISLGSAGVVGVFYWLPVAVAYVSTQVRSLRRKSVLCLSLLLAVFVPVSRWEAFKRSKLWDHLLRYFQVKVVGIAPPSSNENIMYGVAPHGIVPYSLGLMAFGSLSKFLHNPAIATASIIKYIPLFSHMLYWGGAVAATTEDISAVYQDHANESTAAVAITPGGIGEMYLGYPQPGCFQDEEYALLSGRRGFVKLAMQNGATLVPVFVFGASKIFKRFVLPAALEQLSRSLRMSLLLFWGKLGLPIPFEVPLTYALGEHIRLLDHVPIENRTALTAEEVDFVHNTFVKGLHDVFNKNKFDFDWGYKSLQIR